MDESTYSTDLLHRNLWHSMVEDFRISLQDPEFCSEPEQLLRTGRMKEFRTYKFPRRFLRPYYFFKAEYQMENLLKRYRFNIDAYTEEELEVSTSLKFRETQIQINRFDIPCRTYGVLQYARKLVRKVLGKFDDSLLLDLCKHGSRASVGIPLRDAYVDRKFVNALSGSGDQIEWFKKTYLPQDELLGALYKAIGREPTYNVCYNLVQTCVPKSWKSKRLICPNTTLGAFYTRGLGELIRLGLEKEGLNLSTLPEHHKRLACINSRSRKSVTADLSSASDSFSPWLVNRLVPRDWYNALKMGRISHVKIGEDIDFINSFMTMGIGFTFPLQTLLFYSILKGIQAVSKIPGHISVFGDDLIYPTEMHRYVAGVFSDLSFKLNMEKTFVKEEFRESCGGDYYCGIDVRPFQPEGQSRQLTKMGYLSTLYKVYNGLSRRWNACELPLTFQFLNNEIRSLTDNPHYVPPDYPDHSGIKTGEIRKYVTTKVDQYGNSKSNFTYLKLHYPLTKVNYQEFYYWEKLRQLTVSLLTGVEDSPYYPSTIDVLQWVKTKPKQRGISKHKLRSKLVPFVVKRGHPRVRFVEAQGRYVC